MDPKIIAAVLGVLIGGFLSFISFQYRERKETTEKINESLFHLLEIWNLIGAIKFVQSEAYHNALIARIKHRFPNERITEHTEKELKKNLLKGVPFFVNAFLPSKTSFMEKYCNTVLELAKVFPVLAFDLNRYKLLSKILAAFDQYVESNEIREEEETALQKMAQLFYDESFEAMEIDILELASKSSKKNFLAVRKIIRLQKGKHKKIPNALLDEFIERVIVPIVQAHYDNLGVRNPNI